MLAVSNLCSEFRRAAMTLGWIFLLCLSASTSAQSPWKTLETPAPASAQRLKVSETNTSQLLIQRTPPKYPEASVRAGIQGTVVLSLSIDMSGMVQNVTVVSGDPELAQAAVDAVRQWKYKPYLVQGSPVEIDTQATLNFRISTPAPPDLGFFHDDVYRNTYFRLYYPLSHDWVRETEIVRKQFAEQNHTTSTYVLLTEVHIPQDNTEPRADSSFTVFAVRRASSAASDNCKQYLDTLGSLIQTNKTGKLKGGVTQFTFATHDFYREDFESRNGVRDRSTLCTAEKDYLLLWRIDGWTWNAVELAVSTLNSLELPPAASSSQPAQSESVDTGPKITTPSKVKVSSGVTTGLIIKKVVPAYPEEARQNRIQGQVQLAVVINKQGDVVDVEVIDGPLDLAVSAVNAVRLWKYRPYLLLGEPVEVQSTVVVNYSLGP